MSKTDPFSNLEIERLLLSGFLNFPDTFHDFSLIVSSEDFTKKINQTVFMVIKEILTKSDKLDYRLVILKVNELKINFSQELSKDLTASDYIESIVQIKIKKENVEQYAHELKKLSGRHFLAEAARDAYKSMLEIDSSASYSEIVEKFDTTINSKINLFESGGVSNQPIDLFRGLEEEMEQQGNEQKNNGIICPQKILRSKFGDFYPGDVYVWASRQKSGKSQYLMNLLHNCCNDLNQNVKGLYIDTEMTPQEVRWRLMSMFTGISEVHFREGTWRNNKEWTEKVRSIWPQIKTYFDRTQFIYVANSSIENVGSIIRRWYKKNIPRDGSVKALIVYDYIKINSDLITQRYKNLAGSEIGGYKADYIKKLATELQCPILTSVQTNRSNASKKSDDRLDDTSVISMSDQIGQNVSNIYLFNSLTLEELQELQCDYGLNATHRLIPLVTRRQGVDAPGFGGNYVKIEGKDGKIKYVDNVIYFKFENFKVEELTDLATLVKDRKEYKLDETDREENFL